MPVGFREFIALEERDGRAARHAHRRSGDRRARLFRPTKSNKPLRVLHAECRNRRLNRCVMVGGFDGTQPLGGRVTGKIDSPACR